MKYTGSHCLRWPGRGRVVFVASLVVWAAVGAGAGVLVAVISATPARAAACYADPLNTVVRITPNGRGVKSGSMGVFNGDVDCTRVSSLWVENSGGTRRVEVGWYEDEQNKYLCLTNTSGPPELLALAWDQPDYYCLKNGDTVPEGNDGFNVSDENQNGVWLFEHNGSGFWTSPDLGSFTTGLLWNNGERGNKENTAHADFGGLRRMGAGGTWNDPDGVEEGAYSDDPDFKPCLYSVTHTAVKANSTAC